MQENTIPFRLTAILAFCILFSLLFLWIVQLTKTQTIVVFCDVGQGDGAYLRIENKIDVLIDAGPSNNILSCLGKHMPFYDKTIEYAFMSHPQKDHYGGFSDVLDRYRIKTFVVSYTQSESGTFRNLLTKIRQNHTDVLFWYSGTEVIFSSKSRLKFLWPTKAFVERNPNLDPNSYSQILLFSFSGNKILFTGDIIPPQQPLFIDAVESVRILKVPHHGSRNGLTKDLLEKSNPKVAVISVGKNSYGHPSPETLLLLKENGSEIKRTDKMGDIVFEL